MARIELGTGELEMIITTKQELTYIELRKKAIIALLNNFDEKNYENYGPNMWDAFASDMEDILREIHEIYYKH